MLGSWDAGFLTNCVRSIVRLWGVLIETFETQQSSPNWHDGLAAARAQRNKRLCPAGAAEQVLGRGHVQPDNVQALKL